MAGTAKNFDSTKIVIGGGELWADLAVPAAGARLTLDADGTPDATANPNAIHLGHTADGATVTTNFTVSRYYADETPFPIGTSIDEVTVTVSGNLLQVFDEDVLQVTLANIGTYGTAAGYKELTLGRKAALTYTSLAFIVPTPMDATKFGVFALYNAMNTGGMTIQFGRKVRAQTPFSFEGTALTARAEADQLGNYWWQI